MDPNADARRIADELRDSQPEVAAAIDEACDRANREGLKVSLGIHWELRKFKGDPKPGDAPYAVLSGEDTLCR